jgi:hypothetical protein
MDARRSSDRARPHIRWAVRPWTLVVFGLLLMAGTLIQACSDNGGTTGPVFECQEQKGGVTVLAECTGSPAPTTGHANTSADILIRVSANPASTEPGRRVAITVFVTNGLLGSSGQPLAGKRVLVTASGGTIDAPSGVTDANGLYTTSLIVLCVDAGVVPAGPPAPAPGPVVTTVTVNAFVDGASSSTPAIVTVTGTSANAPCPT